MSFQNLRLIVSLVLVLFGVTACADPEVGSKKRPFTMFFVPSVDAQEIASKSKPMEKFVAKYVSQALYQKDEGFYVESSVPTSYVAVVEAFGTDKADFAAFTTSAYILAKDVKKYSVEPMFTIARGPTGAERTYKAQIIARADSGITSVEQLNGKRFAFTDPSSTSGFILPNKLLTTKGVKIGESIFAQKHDNVVTMVYQGQVDAGSTYYSPAETIEKDGKKVVEIRDARMRVLSQFPDVEQKIKIIGFSEEVPNEPWVIRGNLFEDAAQNEKVKRLVKEAILAFIQTPEGKDALWTIATATNLIPASDDTYTAIRKLYLESNIDIAAQVK
jgi:phosphonate transport system substrate-binding protein